MRSFRHWTPRYIANRINEIIYIKTYPTHPWLTKSANMILMSYLRGDEIGLEFGSGRSTLWFAKRVKRLTSVEHDDLWHERVMQGLKENEITNVDYLYVPQDAPDKSGDKSTYVKVMDRFDTNSLDYVLVDGVYRDFCALIATEKVRPGGTLIIDNVNWFLPSDSYSPNSRTPAQGPTGQIWKEVYERLTNWRVIWTSSGVTDTAFFLKPCS